jgi:ADP-heptose:LPS heptosyltransferase
MSEPSVRESGQREQIPGRLLLVRLRSLGDTVLMTPVLTVVKRVPGWQIAVVIESAYRQVLEDNPHIDRLIVIEEQSSKSIARLRAIREIRSFRPTLAIDLHGGTTSALLTALSGAPRRAGYQASRSSFLYNIKIPESGRVWNRQPVHTVEHQLSSLKLLGFPAEPVPPPQITVRSEDVQAVRGLLARQGRSAEEIDEGFILIHPAAAFDTKQWDAEKFAALADRLTGTGRRVLLTAGPGDESLLARIETLCNPKVGFVEPLSIRQFSALASLSTLYVGNDTGSTHIAAALQKKIVVIFGSSDFKVWYPWGVEHRLIRSDLPCMPCPGYFCLHFEEPRCIRSIEVEPVFQAVQSML